MNIMSLNEVQEKTLLKVAQFVLYICNRITNKKNTELILHSLDSNLIVRETNYLKEVDGRNIIGNSLSHLAFRESELDVYNTLISNGADFTIKNEEGNTVLHKVFHRRFIEENKFKRVKSSFIESTLLAHIKYRNVNNPSDPTGLTHFHVACATNNIQAAQLFLNNGLPVNQVVIGVSPSKFFEKYTPLHFAVQFGCIEVIEILLKHGANVKLQDAKGKTPLHICLEKNIELMDSTGKVCLPTDIELNAKIITLLLNHYVSSKFLHLYVASSMQNVFELKKCLNQGTEVNQSMPMDCQIWPGYSALHFAAHVNIDIVKLLIQHGANLQAKEANEVTPFDMCIDRYKVEDIVNVLCLLPSWKNIVLSDGRTKLHRLFYALRNLEAVEMFLEELAKNVKLFVPFDSLLWPGFTILHMAILLTERIKCKTDYKYEKDRASFDPDLTIITECLKQDADVTVKDHRSWTPINFAFRLEKKKTVNLLLQYQHKMDNCVDKDNLSHLHIACASENQDLVKKLLWNNADVNIVYNGKSVISSLIYPGWTPLHVAIYKRNSEIVKLLLKFDADVHAKDQYGFTPIHGLFRSDSTGLSEILFDVSNLRDIIVEDMGFSYLHVACWNNNVDAVKKLLDFGADVNKRITYQKTDSKNSSTTYNLEGYDGCTPLHCVSYFWSHRPELFRLLIEHGADILIKDSNNSSVLRKILNSENEQLMDIAVEALKSNVELRNRVEMDSGLTLLHLACFTFDVDWVKELLDNGADVNARTHENSSIWPSSTCLHVLLSERGCEYEYDDEMQDIMKLLLNRNVDLTLLDKDKNTPWLIIYRQLLDEEFDEDSPYSARLRMLLESYDSFEVNPTSIEGYSHFQIACHMLDVDAVEKFLEYDIDVDARIDPFCDDCNREFAANTPLHLVIRGMNLEETDSAMPLSEMIAQLKIVDLLIKHGADVNTEDVHGNTPAHYVGSCNSSKENLLQRLANGGADLNARNVEGKTPLEMLLIRKHRCTLGEARHFITLGCRFNAFNTVSEKGYVALANEVLSHEDMQLLLIGTLLNSPDMLKADYMNRTAIHNVVSICASETTYEQYIDLFEIFAKFGCDLDDQDNLGRTALHLAALFRNVSAVEGLLLTGADINVTDRSGKTPFAYIFEPCLHCDERRDHDQYSHVELFKIFMRQTKKMEFSNVYVKESNEALVNAALAKFGSTSIEKEFIIFLAEFGKIISLTLEPYSLTVADFVSNDSAVIDYPLMSLAKRKVINAFFQKNKRQFQEKFKTAAGIFQLQYRQAVLRRKIINTAENSLSILMGLSLPDVCSDIILKLLKNHELQNLISSTAIIDANFN